MTRYVLDRGTRRLTAGTDRTVLIGGSPLAVMRLTPAGARLIDRVEAGDDVSGIDRSSPAGRLLEHLLDLGAIHPCPAGGLPLPEVAAVIPVYQRPGGLARTLRALASTAPGLREVIVVDDASPDADTHRRVVAAAHAASPFPVRLLRRRLNGGAGAARNAGARASEAPVLAFVDAGCVPRAGWLEHLAVHLDDPRVALVAPRMVPLHPAAPTAVGRYEAVRSSLDLGPDPAPVKPRGRVPYVPAAAILVRSSALESAGGFEPGLRIGEDVDLVWRLHEAGYRVRYEPAATVAHDHPGSLRKWAARRVDYGSSAALLARRHPGALAPLGVSGWSAAIWALLASGNLAMASLAAASNAASLTRTLRRRGLEHPVRESLELVLRGHAGAGRLIASSVLRVWFPLALAATAVSRRARRLVAAAVVVPALIEHLQRRPALDPVRFAALAAADDAAYGIGVWKGMLRERTLDPAIPTLVPWRA